MKGFRITPARRAAVIGDLMAGMTRKAISAKHGMHHETVARIARDHAAGRMASEATDRECDLTEEDLERLIAEQLPTMPRESRQCGGPMLPLAVSRGRGLQSRARRSEF